MVTEELFNLAETSLMSAGSNLSKYRGGSRLDSLACLEWMGGDLEIAEAARKELVARVLDK